jgi:hypothetical protein
MHEARQSVKNFIRFHSQRDEARQRKFAEARKIFERDLKRQLSDNRNAQDYFTDRRLSESVSNRRMRSENRKCNNVFQVVFFWKDDARSEQREIQVELIKENGNGLINKTFKNEAK